MKRRLVDTNLIVRYLVQDHEKHVKAAGRLFDACDRGEVLIVVLPAVLAECVFVGGAPVGSRVRWASAALPDQAQRLRPHRPYQHLLHR